MFIAARQLEFLSAFKVASPTTGATYTDSPVNTLSYKISGVTDYYQGDLHLVKTKGSVMYLPYGATFTTAIREPGDYIEIYYASYAPPKPEIRLFNGLNIKETEAIFRKIVAAYTAKADGYFFECQSELYKLIAMLKRSGTTYISGRQKELIAPAVEYMEIHLFDKDFTVQSMADRLDISDRYFRHIFENCYGIGPQKYVTSERISTAKEIMIAHPYLPMQSVAESVGYEDAFYFSRVFKKETGSSPSEWKMVRVKKE